MSETSFVELNNYRIVYLLVIFYYVALYCLEDLKVEIKKWMLF